jgi:hypothetical protein
MLESGRNAITSLVEDEGRKTLFEIEILLSELAAYGILLRIYNKVAENGFDYDARLRRLQLRKLTYQSMVPELCERINARVNQATRSKEVWTKARELVPEMKIIYKEVFKSQ